MSDEGSEALEQHDEILQKSDWVLTDHEREVITYTHAIGADHHVRITKAYGCEYEWYGRLFIDEFDTLGDDSLPVIRRRFDTLVAVWIWTFTYIVTHPNGVDPEDLVEPDSHYDWSIHW